MTLTRSTIRLVLTLAIVAAAIVLGYALWQHYMRAPWTRDGRVRADIVDLAPDISGPVAEILVKDNQLVEAGTLLFRIDPERYQVALRQAQAALEGRKHELEIKQSDARRRSLLANTAISIEERERALSAAAVAAAAYEEAKAALATAQLNLTRTEIRAPVTGYVTNLRTQPGDYAMAGKPLMALIDSQSFWVSGYFEETKIPRIHEGSKAEIWLMGVDQPLTGHVQGIARGITDRSGSTDTELLADVNPTFTWVRLAQRIPVRIHIDQVPEHVRLSAGMSCTVIIQPKAAKQ